MYRSSGLGATPLISLSKVGLSQRNILKPVFKTAVKPTAPVVISSKRNPISFFTGISKPAITVVPMNPVVNVSSVEVTSPISVVRSDSVAAVAMSPKKSTTETVAAVRPLISTPMPGSAASIVVEPAVSKPILNLPPPGTFEMLGAGMPVKGDYPTLRDYGIALEKWLYANHPPPKLSDYNGNYALFSAANRAWGDKWNQYVNVGVVYGQRLPTLPSTPLATESAPAATTTPPVTTSAAQEADIKNLLATFPDVLDQAITDYAKLKAGLSYSMKNQTQLFTADQLNTITAWFVKFPDLWDTLAPNYEGSIGDAAADQYRASVKAKAEAFVKKLRGDTVLYPGLGVLPFIIIAGVIIAGLLGVGAAIWAVGYVQQQRNVSAMIDGVVAGKIPADVLDQAITEAQTNPLGQLGDVLKYAAIGAALILAWPVLSNLFNKIGKKA